MDWITTPFGAGAVLVICLTALGLAAMGFRVRATRDGLEASKINQNSRMEPVMPEKYMRPALQLVERSIAHNNRMRDIWPECLEKQMLIYEEREVTAVSMMIEDFVRIIDKYKFSEEIIEDETSRFRSHVCNAFVQVKDHVRRAFRNNHYFEMSESEWEQYLDQKVGTLTRIVSSELDKFWRSPVIPRGMLKRIGAEGSVKYGELIVDVFKKARTISIRSHQEETEERATYSSWIAVMVGAPYPGEDYCA